MRELYRHYDSLLQHAQRAFHINFQTQSVYLRLLTSKTGIKFSDIQHIYQTLTEGKADEAIYMNKKTHLRKNKLFQAQSALRTCWRIVQKLLFKISFYMGNQKFLGYLGPYIFKSISLLKQVKTKSLNRQSFLQYFLSVVDLILEQNNFITQKIYGLLISRGYISSVQQFYRLNRFQAPGIDCIQEASQLESPTQRQKETNINHDFIKNRLLKKSTKQLSTKRMLRTTMSGTSDSQQEQQNQQKQSGSNEKTTPCIQIEERQSEDLLGSQIMDDINQDIQKQLGQAVDELMQQQQFSAQQQSNTVEGQDDQQGVEKSLKKMLKTIKNNYLQVTEKHLVIDQQSITNNHSQSQKQIKPAVAHRKPAKSLNKRNSIINKLHLRMNQQIFKKEQIRAFEQLISSNLGCIQEKSQNRRSSRVSLSKYIRTSFTKSSMSTINLLEEPKPAHQKRMSNIEFLSTAFVFQNKLNRISLSPNQLTHGTSQRRPVKIMPGLAKKSTTNSQSPSFMAGNINGLFQANNSKRQHGSTLLRPSKMMAVRTQADQMVRRDTKRLSKFAPIQMMANRQASSFGRLQAKKRNKQQCLAMRKKVSGRLISCAAKKYHKQLRDEADQMKLMNYEDLYKFVKVNPLEQQNTQNIAQDIKKKAIRQTYDQFHGRRVQVFDRLHRRFL